jgi:hypothetical protein
MKRVGDLGLWHADRTREELYMVLVGAMEGMRQLCLHMHRWGDIEMDLEASVDWIYLACGGDRAFEHCENFGFHKPCRIEYTNNCYILSTESVTWMKILSALMRPLNFVKHV